MFYTYDLFGWFTGISSNASMRSTPVEPVNKNALDDNGALRANWTGREWVDRAFVKHESPMVEIKNSNILTHREFILLLGEDYYAIQRLRDANEGLSISEKNYDLVRIFALWEAASFIDLADADLYNAFVFFVQLGVISSERVSALFGKESF